MPRSTRPARTAIHLISESGPGPIHPQLQLALALGGGLVEVARLLLKAAGRRVPAGRHPRRGATLRPGPRTPLWNALILAVRPQLKPYGAQSRLARLLGVPPQRVHEYFIARTQSPDAERTLQLLAWLARAPRPGRAYSRNK